MNEDQAIQNIDILIDLWKPYSDTLTAATERMIETFLRFCSKKLLDVSYLHNTIQTAIMTSTFVVKPKPQLAIDNRRKRNGLLM